MVMSNLAGYLPVSNAARVGVQIEALA